MFLSRKLIIIILISFCHTAIRGQTLCVVKFSGTIQNEAGEPLSGALITLKNAAIGGTSNVLGEFSIATICPQSYEVTVTHIGYKEMKFTLPLFSDVVQNIKLEPEILELQEIIVQDNLPNTDHAQNFSILTERQLEQTYGKSLGESLKELPGVNTIQTGPGIFKPVIHGVHSNRILILNYGIRQEGQQWGAEHAPEIDPFVASNIVVIKDAAAIKYGTDALGGVIVINPAPLPENNTTGGSITSVFQSNGGSATVSGMIEGGIKKKEGWGWRAQGTIKQGGDFSAPNYSLTNTGIKERNFSLATGYHEDGKGVEVYFSHFSTEIGILLGASASNIQGLQDAMERPVPQSTKKFSYSIAEPRQEVSHNLLKLNTHFRSSLGEWRVQYGFQNNSRKEFDVRIGSLSDVPSINLQLFTHTLEAELETMITRRGPTCIGVTGMFQDNNNIPGTQRIPFIPNFQNQSAGLFGIQKLIVRNFTFDAGIRYDFRGYRVSGFDFSNSRFRDQLLFHNASATLGAVMLLDKKQSLSMNISAAWRPPHVAELYSIGTHQSAASIEYGLLLNRVTNQVMPIADVRFSNEQAIKIISSYEIKSEKLMLSISAFTNYIANFIYLKPGGVTLNVRGFYPYLRYDQTNALFIGTDLAAIISVSKNWKLIPKASLLRVSDLKNNDYLLFIPANRYELAGRYEINGEHFLKNFYIESKVQFIDQQRRAPRTISIRDFNESIQQGTDPLNGSSKNFDFMDAPAAVVLCQASIGFSHMENKKRYDIRLSSDNLFNTNFREYTNRFRYYSYDLGRNIILTLNYKF